MVRSESSSPSDAKVSEPEISYSASEVGKPVSRCRSARRRRYCTSYLCESRKMPIMAESSVLAGGGSKKLEELSESAPMN
jgi:hypothetical protein